MYDLSYVMFIYYRLIQRRYLPSLYFLRPCHIDWMRALATLTMTRYFSALLLPFFPICSLSLDQIYTTYVLFYSFFLWEQNSLRRSVERWTILHWLYLSENWNWNWAFYTSHICNVYCSLSCIDPPLESITI